ncbi:MAG: mobile mystery protein A [Candidatus Cyclonatronum sp.]|uniref:mobile mystery protein A n=1 Tax=Cyclonatronum sp. TaxID=3024185 RepID=UPI0025C4F9B5|nr:mobile mystery protein A [Cyclonatronum sp.]MCC5933360.1 mobile mystery protein A [Balneolales bacterium]MCH8486577.1 mobile mystery protein A [Cyclonatronum sp.]
MDKQQLIISQLEKRVSAFSEAVAIPHPPSGWVKAVRNALGMTLEQLGKKLSVSKQAALEIEKREKEGRITINSLRETAHAMDMKLVYGFVPKDGSFEKLIDKKATALAKEIVLRTSQSMKLEDQENSDERIAKAIEEKTLKLKQQLPKALWD